jgi:hypothetical protein
LGQLVAREHLGRQRVEDASGRVECAVDEGAHPAGLYVLVDWVDGDEASCVRPFVSPWIFDDLDILGGDLDAVAALDLARDHDTHLGKQLVQEPTPSPDGYGNIARAVVELGSEAWRAAPDRLSEGSG